MGERWVSPPTYTRVGEGMTVTVDARAHGVDGTGRSIGIRPEWIPVDPGMVAVVPNQGNEVKITVQRAGQSSLQVTSQGVSKVLTITATYRDKAILVEIAQ